MSTSSEGIDVASSVSDGEMDDNDYSDPEGYVDNISDAGWSPFLYAT